MRTGKKIIFNDVKDWEIQERKIPPLKSNEVLLKVEYCGLCTWERQIYRGEEEAQFPFAGGHEIAARVVEVGDDVTDLKNGDQAAVAKFTRCNRCFNCRRGFDNHCVENFKTIPEGQVWGPGGFGEFVVAKDYEVYKVTDELDIKYAALTEPLACIERAISRVEVNAGEPVVIIGAGLMGVLFLKSLKLRGHNVIVVQRSKYRRDKAARMGADTVIDPTEVDWVKEVKKLTAGRGAQAVFYTAGGMEVVNQSLEATVIGGSVLIYAPLHVDYGKLNIDAIHYRELNLTGSVRHDKESFRRAAEKIGQGIIDLGELDLKTMAFENFATAMEEAERKKNYRILLTWE